MMVPVRSLMPVFQSAGRFWLSIVARNRSGSSDMCRKPSSLPSPPVTGTVSVMTCRPATRPVTISDTWGFGLDRTAASIAGCSDRGKGVPQGTRVFMTCWPVRSRASTSMPSGFRLALALACTAAQSAAATSGEPASADRWASRRVSSRSMSPARSPTSCSRRRRMSASCSRELRSSKTAVKASAGTTRLAPNRKSSRAMLRPLLAAGRPWRPPGTAVSRAG